MTAKEYLNQYRRLTVAQQRLRREIEAIESQIGGNVHGDGTPHGSGVSDLTGALAAELADAKKAYIIAEADAWRKRLEIVQTINAVKDSVHSLLLYDRYVRLMRWEMVAEDIHANESYTRGRLHGAALNAAQEIIDGERSENK